MLLAVGVALQSLGDVMLTFLTSSDGIEPFPSAADVPYLAGYVLIAIGLVELVRAGNREHDRTAWVDALIVARRRASSFRLVAGSSGRRSARPAPGNIRACCAVLS